MQQNKTNTLSFLLLFLSSAAWAQQVAPATNTPATPATVPPLTGPYPGTYNYPAFSNLNYIRTWIPDQPTPVQISTVKHRQVINYFDGLARPAQTVVKKGHSDGHDIVNVNVYDATGKESHTYLPYLKPLNNSGGLWDRYAKDNMESFYPLVNGQQPYAQTQFDNSPLNRPVKAMAPGKSWVGSNRGSEFMYGYNQNGNYMTPGANPTYIAVNGAFPVLRASSSGTGVTVSGNYPEGTLLVNGRRDEDGNLVQDITDKAGRLLARRVLARKAQGVGYPVLAPAEMFPVNFDYTFYVYDVLGRLRVVLPPGAITLNAVMSNAGNTITHTNTWSTTLDQVGGLGYRYVYDYLGRVIEKRIPGKEVEYFVYDRRDRMILSQDGKLRAEGKWHLNFYDAMNRPTVTGIVTDNRSRALMQSDADVQIVGVYGTWPYYTRMYDPAPADIYPAAVTNAELMTYTYYDNYDLLPNYYSSTKIPSPPSGDASVLSSQRSNQVKGMITGTKVRVLESNHPGGARWITSVFYYDPNRRMIQAASSNLKGGIDYQSNLYHFQGMEAQQVVYHQNPASLPVAGATAGLTDIKISRKLSRNLGLGGNDLVWQVQESVNDGAPFNLAYYDYDHMNRVVVKQFSGAHVLQEYNIRGWLNNIHARSSSDNTVNYFNEKLYYDDGFATKLYNGNIAGITWSNYNTNNNAKKHAYGYHYDPSTRLTHAEYRNNFASPALWQNDNKDFTTSNITYDNRGNILSMNQRGNNVSGPIDMDGLSYQYAANSNKLISVTDAVAPATTSHLPDFKDNVNLAEEYTYDDNGNLLTDANKAITSITYNHLNKPEVITVQGKGSITYLYDAAGNRLKKTVQDFVTATTEEWDYIGNFVYKDNVLQYVLNEEGRSRPQAVTTGTQAGSTGFVYDYFIKDHLGNVRTTLAAEPSTMEYFAMHEIATANSEQLLFENIAVVRGDKPGSTNPNDTKAARLNAGEENRKIGTAIMLRVMPGDKFTLAADAYFESEGDDSGEDPLGAEDILNSLLTTLTGGTVGGIPVAESGGTTDLLNNALGNAGNVSILGNLLNTNFNYTDDAPQAGLNYLIFDEEMKLTDLSGSVQINTQAGLFSTISPSGEITIGQPGYMLVYVDNRTIGKDVWFDNVQVLHYSAEVQEENHYYPHGLVINSSAFGTHQPYKYQTKELEKSFGLETYDFHARQYDPQLGRTWQLDPMTSIREWTSPYSWVQNNPINRIDPTGEVDDWVQDDETKEINWDKNATSQKNTKEGQTYVGKELKFIFVSYIDKDSWDGPLGDFPTGSKIISTINVSANTDADNNLLSINVSSDKPIINKTANIFTTDAYYPGQKNYKVNKSGLKSGFNVSYEQHAKVGSFEEMGLGLMGYEKVNVAQKLTIGLDKTKLSITASTDIFPSARLSVNGIPLFKYSQPSFKATHGRTSSYTDNGMGGVNTNDIQNKPEPAFYDRYKR